MTNKSNYEYLLSDLTKLNGVGIKTTNLLKKKKINNIFDLLWKLPKSFTDRSHSTKIKDSMAAAAKVDSAAVKVDSAAVKVDSAVKAK